MQLRNFKFVERKERFACKLGNKCLYFCITVSLVYSICGTLHSVDQFLNIKLTDITVTDPDKYPHMVSQFVCVNNSENHRYKSAFLHPHIKRSCFDQTRML